MTKKELDVLQNLVSCINSRFNDPICRLEPETDEFLDGDYFGCRLYVRRSDFFNQIHALVISLDSLCTYGCDLRPAEDGSWYWFLH